MGPYSFVEWMSFPRSLLTVCSKQEKRDEKDTLRNTRIDFWDLRQLLYSRATD